MHPPAEVRIDSVSLSASADSLADHVGAGEQDEDGHDLTPDREARKSRRSLSLQSPLQLATKRRTKSSVNPTSAIARSIAITASMAVSRSAPITACRKSYSSTVTCTCSFTTPALWPTHQPATAPCPLG